MNKMFLKNYEERPDGSYRKVYSSFGAITTEMLAQAKAHSGSIFVEICDECGAVTDSRNTHPDLGETFCRQACYEANRANKKLKNEVVNG